MVDLLIENYRCQTGKSIIGKPGATDPLQVEIWDQSQEQSIKVFSLHVPVPEVW